MKRWLIPVVTLVVLTASARLQAQEGYTIKFAKPKSGSVGTVEIQEANDESNKLTFLQQNQEKSESKKERVAYQFEETTLEVMPGSSKATKLKRTYQKAEAGSPGALEKLGLDGKTVLIEKKGEKYAFSLEGGGDLSAKALDKLNKEFNKDKKGPSEEEMEKLFLPKGQVKEGESWKVSAADFTKLFASEDKKEAIDFDREKSTASGKLVKAYKQDGKQFGVVELKIDMALKSIGTPEMSIPLQPNAKMTLTIQYDGCIDNSVATFAVRMSMDMQGVAMIPADAPMVRLDLNVVNKMEESRKQTKGN